jgi:hypothetical protein
LVDLKYFVNCSNDRLEQLNVHNSTRLNASEDDAAQGWAQRRQSAGKSKSLIFFVLSRSPINNIGPNFISEIFMLSVYLQHIGTIRLMNSYYGSIRDLSELQSHIERLEDEQRRGEGLWGSTGPILRAQEEMLRKFKVSINQLKIFKVISSSNRIDSRKWSLASLC